MNLFSSFLCTFEPLSSSTLRFFFFPIFFGKFFSRERSLTLLCCALSFSDSYEWWRFHVITAPTCFFRSFGFVAGSHAPKRLSCFPFGARAPKQLTCLPVLDGSAGGGSLVLCEVSDFRVRLRALRFV